MAAALPEWPARRGVAAREQTASGSDAMTARQEKERSDRAARRESRRRGGGRASQSGGDSETAEMRRIRKELDRLDDEDEEAEEAGPEIDKEATSQIVKVRPAATSPRCHPSLRGDVCRPPPLALAPAARALTPSPRRPRIAQCTRCPPAPALRNPSPYPPLSAPATTWRSSRQRSLRCSARNMRSCCRSNARSATTTRAGRRQRLRRRPSDLHRARPRRARRPL